MSKQTQVDFELLLSNAQTMTTTASTGSTNELDLGGTQMGEGTVIKGVVNVSTYNSGTIQVKVCHKTSATVAATDNPITLTTISAVGQYYFTLPQNCGRYVKLYYVDAGAGAVISAWLTAEVSG